MNEVAKFHLRRQNSTTRHLGLSDILQLHILLDVCDCVCMYVRRKALSILTNRLIYALSAR